MNLLVRVHQLLKEWLLLLRRCLAQDVLLKQAFQKPVQLLNSKITCHLVQPLIQHYHQWCLEQLLQ